MSGGDDRPGLHPTLAAYLQTLRSRLGTTPAHSARLLEEIEAHLCEAAKDEELAGASADEAAARAIARCGEPDLVAESFAREQRERVEPLRRGWRGGYLAAAAFGFTLLVASLVVVTGVARGYHEQVREAVRVNGDLIVLKYSTDFSEYRDVIKAVEGVPGVIDAAPITLNPVMASFGGKVAGVIAKGVDPRQMPKSLDLPEQLVESAGGEPLDLQRLAAAAPRLYDGASADGPCGAAGAFVGAALARDLGIQLGDCMELTAAVNAGAPFGDRAPPPKPVRFRVAAVFESGLGASFDAHMVYIDLYEAQSFYDLSERVMGSERVTGIEVKVRDADEAEAVAREIDRRLADRVYRVMSSAELNSELFAALRTSRAIVPVLFAVAVLAAVLAFAARRVRREAALLKALGVSDDLVSRFFARQGAVVGLIGISAGLPLGYGLGAWLRAAGVRIDSSKFMLRCLPVDTGTEGLVFAGFLALIVCTAATFGLAFYAARLREADGGLRR